MGFSFEQFKAMNRISEKENKYKQALKDIATYGRIKMLFYTAATEIEIHEGCGCGDNQWGIINFDYSKSNHTKIKYPPLFKDQISAEKWIKNQSKELNMKVVKLYLDDNCQ